MRAPAGVRMAYQPRFIDETEATAIVAERLAAEAEQQFHNHDEDRRQLVALTYRHQAARLLLSAMDEGEIEYKWAGNGISKLLDRTGLDRLWPNQTVPPSGYSSPWISLTGALQCVAAVAGEAEAWEQVRKAIVDGALSARGLLDGQPGTIQGEWLRALCWDEPDGDVLWFDAEKSQRMNVRPPRRAERIEVDGGQMARLWPGPAVCCASSDGVAPLTEKWI